MTGILLHGSPVGQTGKKVTDGPAHPLFFDAQDRPLRNQMRMKVVEFEQPLEDLTGTLIDLLDVGVLIEIFPQEVPQVLDFHPHRQGEGDQPAPEGAGIGGGGGAGLFQINNRLADGVLHQMVGQTPCNKTAGAFWIEAGVVAPDSGLRLLPKLNSQQSGWIHQAAFQGILQVMTAVGDLIRQIHGL